MNMQKINKEKFLEEKFKTPTLTIIRKQVYFVLSVSAFHSEN